MPAEQVLPICNKVIVQQNQHLVPREMSVDALELRSVVPAF